MEVPVGVVLDDEDVELGCDGVEFLAALQGEEDTGGVVAHSDIEISYYVTHVGAGDSKYSRHGVQQMRSPALGVVPVCEHIIQTPRARSHHTALVSLNRHDLNTFRLRLAQHVPVHEGLAQQAGPVADVARLGAPGVDEQLERLGHAVRGADGQDDVDAALVGDVGVQALAGELPQERVQGRVPLGLAVLQRRREVDLLARVRVRGQRLGDGDVRRRGRVRSGSAGTAVDLQRRGGLGQLVGGGVGLVGRGRPSLWLGGLRLEGVVGEESQVREAWVLLISTEFRRWEPVREL